MDIYSCPIKDDLRDCRVLAAFYRTCVSEKRPPQNYGLFWRQFTMHRLSKTAVFIQNSKLYSKLNIELYSKFNHRYWFSYNLSLRHRQLNSLEKMIAIQICCWKFGGLAQRQNNFVPLKGHWLVKRRISPPPSYLLWSQKKQTWTKKEENEVASPKLYFFRASYLFKSQSFL